MIIIKLYSIVGFVLVIQVGITTCWENPMVISGQQKKKGKPYVE